MSTVVATIGTEITKIQLLFAQADALLIVPLPPLYQYLTNRYQNLVSELRGTIQKYNAPPPPGGQSSGFLDQISRSLDRPDGVKLLEKTVTEMVAARQSQITSLSWIPTQPPMGTLTGKLTNLFQQANTNSTKLHILHLVPAIQAANVLEKSTAGQNRTLMEDAADWIESESLPQFLKLLGVQETGVITHLNPAYVDAAIRAVLGDYLLKPIARGVTVVGSVVVLRAKAFNAVRSLHETKLPGQSAPNAFAEDGLICLSASRGTPSTMIHEGIHLYADGVFRREFGNNIDEGVTEYFARKVLTNATNFANLDASVKNLPPRNAYDNYYAVANALIGRMGESAFADVYFSGSSMKFMSEFINIRTKSGHRRDDSIKDLAAFKEALSRDRFDDAKQMLGMQGG